MSSNQHSGLPRDLREYADAIDKDRGHSHSASTTLMRQGAKRIESLEEQYQTLREAALPFADGIACVDETCQHKVCVLNKVLGVTNPATNPHFEHGSKYDGGFCLEITDVKTGEPSGYVSNQEKELNDG